MASGPRSDVINEDEVGTYHVFNRCVRRAFLCGADPISGKNYDHRKEWFRELLIELGAIFAIDIFKYAVLDNHFHAILRNRPDIAAEWSDEKILRRAMQLFPQMFRRKKKYVEPGDPLPSSLLQDKELIDTMRRRLSSISWFMKVLQERIAKRANREDKITGVFWDGRFRAKLLFQDGAVLACAMYVDLNVMRAGKSDRPENSRFTSAYDRIRGQEARRKKQFDLAIACDGFLCPVNTLGDYEDEDLAKLDRRASNDGMLELSLTNYLRMLDYFGRQLRDGKSAIPEDLPPILTRLGLEPTGVAEFITSFTSVSRRAVGNAEHLRQKAKQIGRRWLHGIGRAKDFFLSID